MKNRKFIKNFFPIVSLIVLVVMQIIFVLLSGSSNAAAQSKAASPAAIIYDNGPFRTGTTARNGTSIAPAGTEWSEASFNFGETLQANTLAGVGCQLIGTTTNNRCADDFNVPVGQTWTINQVITFVYQSGFAGATSPVVGASVRIWSGRPGDPGSIVIAGSTTNNLASSTDALAYRIFNSGPPLNTATGTTRHIWQNNINVVPAAVLVAGTYWVDFQMDAGAGGNFTPNSTITGTRGVPGWNAIQSVNGGTSWAESFDDGTPATALNVTNDFPFKLEGSIAGAPAISASRSLDFDGDNKTDFAIIRAADGASQATWWIQNSSGTPTQTVQPWGTGVGFVTGDKATPADFDGDGKTDIAIWRPGPALVASFFILQSSNGTARVEQFGQLADDPTVVDDYDGDGKADLAVYRPAVVGTFFYRGSLSNPGGAVTFVPWGTIGDVALPGDYDGDGKADYRIFRNVGGSAEHWLRLSTGAISTSNYGLFTDKFATGDFEADGRTDIAAIRTNGGQFDWYVRRSSTGQIIFTIFGNPATDYPVLGDYDGDNKTDFAVWRSGQAATNTNFILINTFTSPKSVEWGQSAGAGTPPDYPAANWNVR